MTADAERRMDYVALLAIPDPAARFHQATALLKESQSDLVRLSKIRADALIEVRERTGWSQRRIEIELGIGRNVVFQLLKRNGASKPFKHLSHEDVRAIRARRLAGETCMDIGRSFDVSGQYVGMICNGRARTDVPVDAP